MKYLSKVGKNINISIRKSYLRAINMLFLRNVYKTHKYTEAIIVIMKVNCCI